MDSSPGQIGEISGHESGASAVPPLEWTQVVADGAVFLALICMLVFYVGLLVRKGRLQMRSIGWIPAAFVLFVGIDHLIGIILVRYPWYRLSVGVKVASALASWGTVVVLIRFLPRVFSLPKTLRLNEELRCEIERQWKTEERVRASEHEWRTLTETVPDIIFTADAGGKCTFVNKRFLEFTGKSMEACLGNGWLEVLHPDDRDRTAEIWRDALAGKVAFEIEYRFRSADGLYRWFIGRSTPVVLPDGRAEKWIGCATDITDRRRAIEELQQSQERFRTVVEAAPNAMIMVDANGRMVLVNSQTEVLFGYSRSELLGQPIEMLVPQRWRGFHPGHRDHFMVAPLTRPMGAGRDLYGLRKDGSEVPIEIGLNPIQAADGTAVLASIIDITERKRAEDAIRTSLSEKESLLKEIHHRVKNNLQVISSLLQLQARQLKEPGLMRPFRESQDRIRSMALIHEKLYRSGTLASIELGEYLRSLVAMIQRSNGEDEHINLELDVEPAPVVVDVAVPVGLVVNELVTNAFKYAFAGGKGGRIVVAFHREADNGCLEISDDGVGLPAEFDPAACTSLGMRLVQIFARQLRGEFSWQSAHPGTIFRLRFQIQSEVGDLAHTGVFDSQNESQTVAQSAGSLVG